MTSRSGDSLCLWGGPDCLQSGRRSRTRSLAGLSRLPQVAPRQRLRATRAPLRDSKRSTEFGRGDSVSPSGLSMTVLAGTRPSLRHLQTHHLVPPAPNHSGWATLRSCCSFSRMRSFRAVCCGLGGCSDQCPEPAVRKTSSSPVAVVAAARTS